MVNKIKLACRVCLIENEGSVSLYDIYDSTTYNDLIKDFTGLDMIKSEFLPSVICGVCSSELVVVVNFISKCRSSQTKLQEFLKQSKPYETDTNDSKDDVPLSLLCNSNIKEEPDFVDDYDNFTDNALEDPASEKPKIKKVKVKKKGHKGPFQCMDCGIFTTSNSALISHRRVHTGEKPFACTECDKCFSQSSTLKEHIGRVHMRSAQLAKKSCVCDFCGKICYRKNELRVHMRIHTKEKPYQCSICPESFSQQSTLIQHVRRHKGEKPFSCHMCGRCFVSQSGLRSHMMVHSQEKKYKCHICDKFVKSNGALNKHLLGHSAIKPNICDQCGVAFAQKGNLKHHILAKHSERSGTCEICKKTCSDLRVHMLVHSGEKPLKCEVCRKGFLRLCHLTSHMKRHQEPSKFACTERDCDAAFPMQCQLEFHILKFHTKYFPFKCDVCSKGFYRLTDLNKHANSNSCKQVPALSTVIKVSRTPPRDHT